MKIKPTFSKKISIDETNINLISDIDIEKHNIEDFIISERNLLKDYMVKNPLFAKTLKPYKPYNHSNHYKISKSNELDENKTKHKPQFETNKSKKLQINKPEELQTNKSEKFQTNKPEKLQTNNKKLPKIIELMITAANIAKVGPTATIAGTISELTLDFLIKTGSKYSIVDNGGDIAFLNNYEKKVIFGIYAGKSPLSGKIGLEFKPKKKNYPLGICSSSASVGYSLSYGRSDCVTVIANQASIADGLATSIGNKVNGKLDSAAVENGLNFAEEFEEYFIGALIIVGETIGTIGKVPKIVETK
ncbi:MAG: UPF0280 family protein [Methanobrevibacter sp.]|nr:UPF0280 family protein [Methanobrevibacter sp.]